MRETFAPGGVAFKQGDVMTRPRLAKTLTAIANEGIEAFYNGSIARNIVATAGGNPFGVAAGILTEQDLADYRAVVRPAVRSSSQDVTVVGAPPPASGAVLAMAMNILSGYDYTCGSLRSGENVLAEANRPLSGASLEWHRRIEAFKFSYGSRTRMADPCCNEHGGAASCMNATTCQASKELVDKMLDKDFARECRSKTFDNTTFHDPAYYGAAYSTPETPGTTHLSVVNGDGSAAAVTSTVNLEFGSKLMTQDGIILNNQMDDFSTPGLVNAFG